MASVIRIVRSDRAFCDRIHFAIMIKFRATAAHISRAVDEMALFAQTFPDTVYMERFLLPHQGAPATHLAAASALALPKEQTIGNRQWATDNGPTKRRQGIGPCPSRRSRF
jgi:hypothetical protein